MEFIETLLGSTIRMTTPFLLASLGLVIAERAGLMQVTSEGYITFAAFAAYWGVSLFNGNFFLSILFAVLCIMCFSLIYSACVVTLPCRPVIVGTAMNMFIPGLATFLYRRIFVANTTAAITVMDAMDPIKIPLLSEIPVIGVLFEQSIFTYIAIVMVFVVWFVLYRTSLGIKIIAAGEHPLAAETAGIRVIPIRYGAVLFSAAITALAGAYLSLAQSGVYSQDMAAGRGFIAMAIVVIARWDPFGALLGSLMFGLANASVLSIQAAGVNIPSNIILMLPYVLSLLIVIVTSFNQKQSVRPSGIGQHFKANQ